MNAPVTPPLGPSSNRRSGLTPHVLDVLCPMHLVLDATGDITHAGPTLRKMIDTETLRGTPFLEVFDIKRPRDVQAVTDLALAGGTKLHLTLRKPPHTALKGVVVPMDGAGGNLVVNLSFGISIMDGVRDYALTNADFAATDLAIEMLYLIEAKTAAMEASRKLNLRLQGAKNVAEEAALTDTLTGLKNRRAMDQVLTVLVEGRSPFAVMHIDLDFFKEVNDTLGHAAGDHVLQVAATIMIDETRESDIVARVGGDEFTILFPNVTSPEVARSIGERIVDRLNKPIPFEDTTCKISASIGTVWIEQGERPCTTELLANADIALYASKHAGRACQTFYTPELREKAHLQGPPKGRDAPIIGE